MTISYDCESDRHFLNLKYLLTLLIFLQLCLLLCCLFLPLYWMSCPLSSLSPSLLPFFSLIEAWWYLSSLWNGLFLLLSFPVSWDLSWVPTVCVFVCVFVGVWVVELCVHVDI